MLDVLVVVISRVVDSLLIHVACRLLADSNTHQADGLCPLPCCLWTLMRCSGDGGGCALCAKMSRIHSATAHTTLASTTVALDAKRSRAGRYCDAKLLEYAMQRMNRQSMSKVIDLARGAISHSHIVIGIPAGFEVLTM